MAKIVLENHPWVIYKNVIRKRSVLIYKRLDPSWFRWDIGSPNKGLPNIMTKHTANQLEKIG